MYYADLGLNNGIKAEGMRCFFLSFSNLSAVYWSRLRPVNMFNSCDAKKFYHSKALTSPYPGSHVERSRVPEDKVGWLIEWEDYNPVEYTARSVLAGPSWADPQIK